MAVKDYLVADPARETAGPDVGHLPRSDLFGVVANATTRFTGGRWGFSTALAVIVLWLVAGPFCHFSDNWQLVISSGHRRSSPS